MSELCIAVVILAFAVAMPMLLMPTVCVFLIVLLERLGLTFVGKIAALLILAFMSWLVLTAITRLGNAQKPRIGAKRKTASSRHGKVMEFKGNLGRCPDHARNPNLFKITLLRHLGQPQRHGSGIPIDRCLGKEVSPFRGDNLDPPLRRVASNANSHPRPHHPNAGRIDWAADRFRGKKLVQIVDLKRDDLLIPHRIVLDRVHHDTAVVVLKRLALGTFQGESQWI